MEKTIKLDLNLAVALVCHLRNQGYSVPLSVLKHAFEEIAMKEKLQIEDDLKNVV